MSPASRHPVPFLARPAYRQQLLASALDGAFSGILELATFVASKHLGALRGGIILYTAVTSAGMFTAPYWAARLETADRRRLFLAAGLLGRLLLVLAAAVGSPTLFLALVALQAFAHPAVLPALNVLWQSNYPDAVRGRVLGRITVVSTLVNAATSLGGGALLQHEPELYRLLFPLAGVLGFTSYAILGSIRIRRRRRAPAPAVPLAAPPGPSDRSWPIPRSLRDSVRLLRDNPSFAVYELGFMTYGLGFFFTYPLLADYCARDLHLDYTVYTTARAIQQLAQLAFSPVFGGLLDRLRAARTAAATFGVLVPFALAMAAARGEGMIYVAFAIFGAGMSGVNICWTLGTVEFAGVKDAARFMGVHAGCVGIRSTVGPLLAYAVQAAAGHDARAAFLAAAGFFSGAVAVMARLARRLSPVAVRPAPPVPVGIPGAPKPGP